MVTSTNFVVIPNIAVIHIQKIAAGPPVHMAKATPPIIETKDVTFFSRSKQRLWTKGETSGNKLLVKSIEFDCDKDALLIKAKQLGPTCHLENYSCFKSEKRNTFSIIAELEATIEKRKNESLESFLASK